MEKHHLFILLSRYFYAGASCNSMLARQHMKKKKKKKVAKHARGNCHFPEKKEKKKLSILGGHTISPDCGRLKIEDKIHQKR